MIKMRKVIMDEIQVGTDNPPPEIYYPLFSEKNISAIDYKKGAAPCTDVIEIKLVYKYARKIHSDLHVYIFAGWRSANG